jgi:hypothetical protein
MALIGVPAKVVALVAPLHLFSQFWYHTRLIDRMGVLEYVLVTPSHHRVHHAINQEYLDKNFSEIFIIWDKLFGTFKEEMANVPPVYGTKRPAATWNPILINYMHLWSILQDAWRTRSWRDKFRIWFMPTGWRPADVTTHYPIPYYRTAAEQVKYDTYHSLPLRYWSWGQLVINFALMYHLMLNIGTLSFAQILAYSGFIMVSVFAYTTLMDRHRFSLLTEVIKLIYGLLLLALLGGWFGLSIFGTSLVICYLVVSISATVYFVRRTASTDSPTNTDRTSQSFPA